MTIMSVPAQLEFVGVGLWMEKTRITMSPQLFYKSHKIILLGLFSDLYYDLPRSNLASSSLNGVDKLFHQPPI